MYKINDDLRQDQLAIQILRLMDGMLKDINLNCHFMPYKVLAMSEKEGMLEFVPDSKTV